MNVIIKISLILIILIISSLFVSLSVYGADDFLGDLDNYREDSPPSSKLADLVNPVITIIQTVGSIISVGALIVIGMKYMFASLEEKAEYKNTFKGYIIGCIILFAISNLLMVIYELAINI